MIDVFRFSPTERMAIAIALLFLLALFAMTRLFGFAEPRPLPYDYGCEDGYHVKEANCS